MFSLNGLISRFNQSFVRYSWRRTLCTFDSNHFLKNLNPSYFETPYGLQDFINDCQPRYSPKFTTIFNAYKNAEIKTLNLTQNNEGEDKFVKFIDLGCDPILGTLDPLQPLSGIIIERSFYPDLLDIIRNQRKCILTGNAGTGKSYFEFYYLFRLIQALPNKDQSKIIPLPGSMPYPDVVLHEIGDSKFVVYFMKEGKAFTVNLHVQLAIKLFDTSSNLHLIEPEGDILKPPHFSTYIQSFKANSMDLKYGIEEFGKHHPVFYMPIFEFWEFKLIGQYFREKLSQNSANSPYIELYSEENIEKRFKLYNGIFRHVFPQNSDAEEKHLIQRNHALLEAPINLLKIRELDQIPLISNKLMVIDVPKTGPDAFQQINNITPAGFDIWSKFFEQDAKITMTEIRERLMKCDTVQSVNFDPRTYETYFAYFLSTRLLSKVEARSNGVAEIDKELNLTSIQSIIEISEPVYKSMKINVAYKPSRENYPVADVLLKDDKGDLYLFNMKTQKSTSYVKLEDGAYETLLKNLEMTVEEAKEKMHYVVVPLHSMSKKISISYKKIVQMKSFLILIPNKDYSFGSTFFTIDKKQ